MKKKRKKRPALERENLRGPVTRPMWFCGIRRSCFHMLPSNFSSQKTIWKTTSKKKCRSLFPMEICFSTCLLTRQTKKKDGGCESSVPRTWWQTVQKAKRLEHLDPFVPREKPLVISGASGSTTFQPPTWKVMKPWKHLVGDGDLFQEAQNVCIFHFESARLKTSWSHDMIFDGHFWSFRRFQFPHSQFPMSAPSKKRRLVSFKWNKWVYTVRGAPSANMGFIWFYRALGGRLGGTTAGQSPKCSCLVGCVLITG